MAVAQTTGQGPAPQGREARLFDRRTPPHVATLVILSILSALNMNFFLPSMPSMASSFGTDYAVIQLAVSAYLAATALLQLVIGPLSDRYGRRPVLLWAIALFVVASIGCAMAPTIELFLACRVAQACIVSGLVLSRAIVRDMYGPAQSASIIGYVTAGMALAPMVGPTIGGLLDEAFGWRTGFFGIAGLGILVGLLIFADLGETHHARASSFGAQFRAYPELVGSRRFWGYALMAASANGAFFAFLGGGPYVASVVLGLSPGALGFYFSLIAIGYMIGNFLSGRYAVRIGMGRMMVTGSCTTVTGMVITLGLFAADIVHPLSFFGPILLVGLGNGLSLPSANAGMLSVRPHLAGSASGLGGALMIGGGAVLAALSGALLGPESGAEPLLWVMFAASCSGLLTTFWVVLSERRSATATPVRGRGGAR
jgi:DHA1 family bicyclomycin/chloramphenicol resistance-like MFS transporter